MDPQRPELGWGPNPAYGKDGFTARMARGLEAITPDPIHKWLTDVFTGAQEWVGRKTLDAQKERATPEQLTGLLAFERGEPTMGPIREPNALTPFSEFTNSGNPVAELLGGADPTGTSSALAAGDLIGNADMFGPLAKRAKALLKEWDNLGIKNMTMADALDYLKRKPSAPMSEVTLQGAEADQALRAQTEMQEAKRVTDLVDLWKSQGYKPEQAFAELKKMGVDPRKYEDLIGGAIGERRSDLSRELRDAGYGKDEIQNIMQRRNVADEGIDPATGEPFTAKSKFESSLIDQLAWGTDRGRGPLTEAELKNIKPGDITGISEKLGFSRSEVAKAHADLIEDARARARAADEEIDITFDEDVPRGYLDSRATRPGNEPLTPEEYASIARPEDEMPSWLREKMQSRGLDPNRPFNDVDVSNPEVRKAIELDPTLTPEQKKNILKTGSPAGVPFEDSETFKEIQRKTQDAIDSGAMADFTRVGEEYTFTDLAPDDWERVNKGELTEEDVQKIFDKPFEYFADLRDAKGNVKEKYYKMLANYRDRMGHVTKKGTRVTEKWLKDNGFLYDEVVPSSPRPGTLDEPHPVDEMTDKLRRQGVSKAELDQARRDVTDFRKNVGKSDAYEFFADLKDAKGNVKETYYTLTADITDDTGYTTKKGTRVTATWLRKHGWLD